MPQFAYSAINAEGNELSGEIHAADVSSARDVLLNGGLLAEKIAEIKASAGSDIEKRYVFCLSQLKSVFCDLRRLSGVRDRRHGTAQ